MNDRIPAYVGVDGVTYRRLVPVSQITITRAEGPTCYCDRPYVTDNWIKASGQLLMWSTSAPKCGGYDKCDYQVFWADGFERIGRYDLQHTSVGGIPNLARDVYEEWRWLASEANTIRPGIRPAIEARLLQYDVHQPPVLMPAWLPINVERDYRTHPRSMEEIEAMHP